MNTQNFFQEFQEKKQQICILANEALKAGWIDQTAHNDILKKINDDILTIGVIGQMKCGKSTFLNAFLFNEQLLPAATTPMTAALSVITYGEKKEIEIEFYSENEWEELKQLATYDLNEINDTLQRESVKAAKELYEKSNSIKSKIPNLLGTIKKDSIDQLIEYVGAEGKYVSIVKSVRITLPYEWLKGVEIVDTPGFNDPVVSREERTKEFLKRADVVLMMLYAGRALDATDCNILFDKVGKIGIGKVILTINKCDIQLAQGEDYKQIKDNVKNELNKALSLYKDNSISELLSDIDPITISAQMALLGRMPMSDVLRDENLKHHYHEYLNDIFDHLKTQKDLLQFSQISVLEDKIKDIISTEKEEILIRKPTNLIFQKAKNAINDIETQIIIQKEQKANLELPDEELEEKIANLQKMQRRIQKKFEFAQDELGEKYDDISRKIVHDIEDIADNCKSRCNNIIDTYKKAELERKLDAELKKFEDRELKRYIENINSSIKKELRTSITELANEVEDVIGRYNENGEYNDLSRILLHTINKAFESTNNNTNLVLEKEENDNTSDILTAILLLIPTTPIIYGLFKIFDSGRDEARTRCNDFFNSINYREIEEKLKTSKSRFINVLNGDAINKVLSDLIVQAEKAEQEKAEKEKNLQKVKENLATLNANKAKIEEEYKKLQTLIL
ncbi:MAG: dynamin family protein [Paludibacteraceae bacterium]|nr:dynamin family protein [Clostridia bacterium]MBQ8721845.1 dynamin family protein [Paludibacteraceae bacterium]